MDARAAGVDVRAMTVWALLGSFDWDSLVVRDRGRYKPGVFPRRGALGLVAPRPRYSALGSQRGLLLSTLDDALARYLSLHRGGGPARP